jgi:hypothetical protein
MFGVVVNLPFIFYLFLQMHAQVTGAPPSYAGRGEEVRPEIVLYSVYYNILVAC